MILKHVEQLLIGTTKVGEVKGKCRYWSTLRKLQFYLTWRFPCLTLCHQQQFLQQKISEGFGYPRRWCTRQQLVDYQEMRTVSRLHIVLHMWLCCMWAEVGETEILLKFAINWVWECNFGKKPLKLISLNWLSHLFARFITREKRLSYGILAMSFAHIEGVVIYLCQHSKITDKP